ncbi:MAG: putative structural protein [Diabrotica undecimpunctata virus 2]|nr:MAG: putative structural protein [Diabrotica undecimpunctata virus 2]
MNDKQNICSDKSECGKVKARRGRSASRIKQQSSAIRQSTSLDLSRHLVISPVSIIEPELLSETEEVVVKMAQELSYKPWTPNMELVSYGQFANAKHLLDFVNNARLINFSLNEQRQQTLERLNKIVHEAPFTRTTRFPEHGLFVDLDHGDWDRKMQQVRNALSFKDPKGADRGHSSQEYNDALLSFSNGLNAIVAQIRRKDGVFGRATFENYFDLTWGN